MTDPNAAFRRLVYIAGRVRRYPTPMTPWVGVVLAFIRGEAAALGVELHLPEPEEVLETARPQPFFHEISKRIGSADAVITLWENDAPSAVESTLAAIYGKPQMIVTRPNEAVPRLLQGAPALTEVITHTDLAAISSFLRRVIDSWGELSAADDQVSDLAEA